MNCFELLPKERVMEAYEKQVNPPRRTEEEVVAVGQVEVVEVPVTESESESCRWGSYDLYGLHLCISYYFQIYPYW
jgi:hypothetical protein